MPNSTENPDFLQKQLITYIGNKRALLPFIGQAVELVRGQLHKEKLHCLDVFSGSGIVARYLKQFSASITVNDLERYSYIINSCYLTNRTELDEPHMRTLHGTLLQKIGRNMNGAEQSVAPGFIAELYAPKDENRITTSDRCFYTPYNARYLDTARQLIESEIPPEARSFFIAPLLSEASIHANTAGIFKGFYKNSLTHTGQFGGNGKNALTRILGKIELPYPVLSEFSCPAHIFSQDANALVQDERLYAPIESRKFDLAYIDPPYNQHPYGSNYFMLNLIADYRRPDTKAISRVSGIPRDWNRSDYNKRHLARERFFELVKNVRAEYLLVSFNSEGFIQKEELLELLSACGDVQVLEENYNAFRGSRNLSGRALHVKEFLFLVHKNNLV